MSVVPASLTGLGVPAAPEGWEQLGFTVTDGAIALANGALLLGQDGLVVDGDVAVTDLEGVPVRHGAGLPSREHPCGALGLDHLVLLTDSMERTSAAVEAAFGLPRRRVRETGTVRQAFHRFADVVSAEVAVRGCILEIVETDRVTAPSLMGVVVNLADLHGWAERLGADVTSPPKPATQPGRFISTVRSGVGLGTGVALMTPD